MAESHRSVLCKPNVDYSWSDTDMREIHFGYRWNIKKFSYFQEKTRECIKSCTFSASGDEENKWCLLLYPRGCNELHKDDVSLFLFYTHTGSTTPVTAAFEFFILNNRMKKMNIKKADLFKFHMKSREWGFKNFIDRDDLTDLLYNDELTVCCEVTIITKRTTTVGNYNNTLVSSVTECRVTEDLGHLLKTRELSDTVLVAPIGQEIYVHKAILAARSPVFAAMFTHNMKEKHGNRVKITDIDYKVLLEMVKFIYTGKVQTLDDKLASGLLISADKYGLDGLKELCEHSLAVTLSPEKVVKLIPLASLHRANYLKARLIDFMKSCASDDVINCLWDDLISSHPNIVVEAFLKAKAK